MTTPSPRHRVLLALDTGSPVVSVAVALDGEVRATAAVEQARSSVELLQRIEECLRACDLRPRDLGALAVLRGPGSFTGLRVGLATAQGLHAALGLAVAVLPSLQVLALQARERIGGDDADRTLVGAIDALRGEWFTQRFGAGARAAPAALGAAAIVPANELAAMAPATVIGFGMSRIANALGEADLAWLEAEPLAATAARLAPLVPAAWDATLLTQPLYLREPAVTLPAG